MANGIDKEIWQQAIDPAGFALPVAFTFIVAGAAGAFGVVNLPSTLLLLAAALGLQILSGIARVLGDRLDRERARRAYYERKFAEFKRFEKRYDPVAGTAGDLATTRLRSLLALDSALTAVLGYAFALSLLGEGRMPLAWASLAGVAVAIAVVLLRYLGDLRLGYRPWGAAVVFALAMAGCLAAECLLVGRFMVPLIYPAVAFGAIAVATANLGDIARMEADADFSQSDEPRRTVPLAAGINGAFMLQTVAMALAMVWLAVFPFSVGALTPWSYAFALFYIPMAFDLSSLRRLRPSGVGRLRLSLAISTVLASVAFFFCVAGVNLNTFLLFLVV